jgi:hypothetical protein
MIFYLNRYLNNNILYYILFNLNRFQEKVKLIKNHVVLTDLKNLNWYLRGKIFLERTKLRSLIHPVRKNNILFII